MLRSLRPSSAPQTAPSTLPLPAASLQTALRDVVHNMLLSNGASELARATTAIAGIVRQLDVVPNSRLNDLDVVAIHNYIFDAKEHLKLRPDGLALLAASAQFDRYRTGLARKKLEDSTLDVPNEPNLMALLVSTSLSSVDATAAREAKELLTTLRAQKLATMQSHQTTHNEARVPAYRKAATHRGQNKRRAVESLGAPLAGPAPEAPAAKKTRRVRDEARALQSPASLHAEHEGFQRAAQIALGHLNPPPSTAGNLWASLTRPASALRRLSQSQGNQTADLRTHNEAALSAIVPDNFVPFDPLLTFGVKHAPLPAELHHYLGLPADLRVRELTTVEGSSYFITQSFVRGAFGKVRVAIGRDGQFYAIKQMRTLSSIPKGELTATGKTVPAEVDGTSIIAEMTAAALVEPDIAPLERIDIQGDSYVVMPLMLGDASDIMRRIPLQERRAVTRVTMQQASTSLADNMHAKGIIHDDLRFENILIAPHTGQAHISDFGTAHPVDAEGVRHELRPSGTFVAPEKMLQKAYTLKADVWELGASFLSLHASALGTTYANPFHYKRNQDGGIDVPAMQARHALYAQWTAQVTDAQGRIVLSRLMDRDDPFSRIFRRAYAGDAQTAEFVRTRILLLDPEQRATSQEVKTFFTNLNASTPYETSRAKTILARMPFDAKITSHMQGLKRVRDYFGRLTA